MRLIDADELKKKIEIEYNNNVGSYCDGLLGAEELIDNAPTVEPTFKPIAEVKFDKEQLQEIVDKAKAEVLASVEIPQGEWKITEAYPHKVYCGECYKTYAQENWEVWKDGSLPRNFCPNCGADMRNGEEE